MTKKTSQVTKLIAVSGLFAGAAGFVAGLLSAPKSGKEIRSDIYETTERGRIESEKELKRLNHELNQAIMQASKKVQSVKTKTKKELENRIAKADQTNAKVREILSALHEGDAEDQDLKRAISSAKNALEHLADYLSK